MTEAPTLFPYQATGASWLASKRLALLADEMGLGKSAQAITACDLTKSERVLVLCPAVARENWRREFARFAHTLRSFTLVTNRKPLLDPAHSIICSYDLAAFLPRTESFDALILDEAHYLKTHLSKRTHTVFSKDGLCRRSKRVWALTGTPMPNNPSELWVLLYSFGATKLSYDKFVDEYCTFYDNPAFGRKITGAKVHKLSQLKLIIKPFILRRRKEEVMKELPPIHYMHSVVDAGPVDLEIEASFIRYVFPTDQRALLSQKLKREKKILDTLVNALPLNTETVSVEGMKALEALAGSVSTLRRYTGLQKVKAVAELVQEELMFGSYEKIVIFAIHRDVIEGLRSRLSEYGAVTLYGNTPPPMRQKKIDKFQENPKCRVFIGNIMAAGTAITLTAANQVLFIEQSWTPGDNAQAAMRCHRIGQKNTVFVRFIGLSNSIDDRVSHVLKIKAMQINELFDGEVDAIKPSYAYTGPGRKIHTL